MGIYEINVKITSWDKNLTFIIIFKIGSRYSSTHGASSTTCLIARMNYCYWWFKLLQWRWVTCSFYFQILDWVLPVTLLCLLQARIPHTAWHQFRKGPLSVQELAVQWHLQPSQKFTAGALESKLIWKFIKVVSCLKYRKNLAFSYRWQSRVEAHETACAGLWRNI